MNKKLIAIAVAGALATPAMALAANSTVSISGTINYEYGIVNSGQGRGKHDNASTPGGSNIRFKGEEKLGRGLSAWFQCESSADVTGIDQRGLCTRNSAVGFKGGFGNVHFGRWDTPFKRALNLGTVGAEATGILGMSFLPFGGSGGSDATGTGPDSTQRQRWKRRDTAQTYYESPKFSGFQVLAAFTPGNGASNNSLQAQANPNRLPRTWSIAGIYKNGPLGISGGYEKHVQFGSFQGGATTKLDDNGWGLGAVYTFAKKVKLGVTYLNTKYETSAVTERKRASWTVGVDWKVAGPHSVQAQYANMGNTKGNDLCAVASTPTSGVGGRLGGSNGGVGCTGSATGADAFTLSYSYKFSKRTRVKFGFIRVKNDSNTNLFRLGESTGSPANGQSVNGYAMHIQHNF